MLRRTLLCPMFFLAACTTKTSQPPPRNDLSIQVVTPDLASSSAKDLAQPVVTVDFAGLDFASASPPDLTRPSGCHVVINELVTGTSQEGTAEWIELFNPCPAEVNLSDWSLRYRSDKNVGFMGGDSMLVNNLQLKISAGGYLVYGGAKYSGTKDGALGSGLATDGGGVGLFDATMTIVDAVAYGTAVPNHNFLEGTVAPQPATQGSPGQSIARKPNGTDTDDNGADFKTATPTPRASN